MKQSRALLLAMLSVGFSLYALTTTALAQQKNTADKTVEKTTLDKTVLAKVGKESITYKMLEDAYRKNMSSKTTQFSQLSADSLKDFLNLYVNYRLKVQDAIGRGYNKKPEIVMDIKQNRVSLATPYFWERKLTNPTVNLAVERRKKEFKVGLILSNILSDSVAAYKRALKLIDMLKSGTDFVQLAKDSTDDQFGKNEGGVYGPVTSFQLLRQIENFVYTAKPGDICSTPIRTLPGTPPGYFIAKLMEIRPRISVLPRQITFNFVNAQTATDSAAVWQRADSVLKLLRNGADFAQLARAISDEKATSENGGKFISAYSYSTGYLNGTRYRVPKPVVDKLYAMKDGELSDVVKSDLGLHILRRDSSFVAGDDREELKKFYKRVHFDTDRLAFLDSVKKARKFAVVTKTLDAFLKAVDTTKTFDSTQSTKLPKKLLKEPMFAMAKTPLSVQRFSDSLIKSPNLKGFTMNHEGTTQALRKLVDGMLVEMLTNNLETEYPEFGALMREFQEGILIFRVEEQEIWNKMKFDTLRARTYHDSLKTKFMTEVKYDCSEIYVKDSAKAQKIYAQLKTGVKFDSLAAAITEREGFAMKKGRWGEEPIYANIFINAVAKAKVGEFIAPMAFQSGYSIGKLNAIIPARQKSFDEALPDFAAQFQDMTQHEFSQKWTAALRTKYPVTIDFGTIEKLWHRTN